MQIVQKYPLNSWKYWDVHLILKRIEMLFNGFVRWILKHIDIIHWILKYIITLKCDAWWAAKKHICVCIPQIHHLPPGHIVGIQMLPVHHRGFSRLVIFQCAACVSGSWVTKHCPLATLNPSPCPTCASIGNQLVYNHQPIRSLGGKTGNN